MSTVLIFLIGLVFYTYLGYGLLMLLLVRLKRLFRSEKKLEEYLPEVTLVVPCFNEEDFIQEKIANTQQLDYPKDKLRVVFITDGSTDRTVQILEKEEGLELMHRDIRAGKAAAMNRAMKAVDSEVVVFCDANTELEKGAIRNIARHYQDPLVGGVSGEKRVRKTGDADLAGAGEGLYWKYESALKKLDSELWTIVGAAGELVSFRTSLWQDLEEDSILDDFMMSMRIAAKGYRFIYEPEAYAIESPSADIREELKRKVRIAAGGWQSMSRLAFLLWPFPRPVLSFMYISHRVLRWSVSALALPLIFLLNAALLTESNGLKIIFVLQLLFYGMASVGAIQAKKNIKSQFYVPYYFCLMNYAVFAGYFRWKKGQQSAVWERSKRA
jgi:cellulose synthase/poly-beta-1,6-N-acetylglucosamine synthase-like glycosyltransferase